MGDQEKSAWEKALDEISSPWDWVALGLGAVGGAGVTLITHGTDLGTSIATGALIGVTARKAVYASLQRARLKRRASGLRAELKENSSSLKGSIAGDLVESLDREFRLWSRKAISDSEFSKQLDETVERYRQLSEKRSLKQLQQQNPALALLEEQYFIAKENLRAIDTDDEI